VVQNIAIFVIIMILSDFITKNLSADTTSFLRHLHVDSDSCVTMLVIVIILTWPNHVLCFQAISNIFRNGKQTV